MNALINTQRWNKVMHWLTRRLTYHSLFWLLILILLMQLEEQKFGFWFSLSNELINVLFNILIVYFNILYLVPAYLVKGKYAQYLILLLATTFIVTPLRIIIFYAKFAAYPTLQQELLTNLNLYFLITFFIANASTVVKIISDWFRQQRQTQELRTQNMQSELNFLKSQINPHFLFNTLNNLYALTLRKSDKAPDIVIKLAEMMRYMLYECNEKKVPLSKEINYLRNYLDLEQLRQHEGIDIRFSVNGNIHEQQIAPLLIIPFLENAFKHGVNHQLTEGFIHVSVDIADTKLTFHIENSKGGPIIRPDGRRSGGIGLVNVRRRLDLLYPGHYQLAIDDHPHTYSVHLSIELI
jgi:sensor histidine kinase YesM